MNWCVILLGLAIVTSGISAETTDISPPTIAITPTTPPYTWPDAHLSTATHNAQPSTAAPEVRSTVPDSPTTTLWPEVQNASAYEDHIIGTTAAEAGCYYNYNSESGNIYSPNYPGNYLNNINCVYDIDTSGQSNWTTTLEFITFDLEECNANCVCDNLNIYRDIGNGFEQVGTYCRSDLPRRQFVQGRIRIRFVTDSSAVGRGFHIRYSRGWGTPEVPSIPETTASEGGPEETTEVPSIPQTTPIMEGNRRVLWELMGTISSPNFPNHYPNGLDLEYTIPGRLNYKTELTFLRFDLEKCAECHCDHLTVYHGESASSGEELGRFCGNELPQFMSINGPVTLKFTTDRLNNALGFRLFYQVVKKCGAVYSHLRGAISTPNHPSSYPNNVDCDYVIPGRRGNMTILRFTEFNMEAHQGCLYDRMTVYHGYSSEMGRPVDRFCGSDIPPVISHDGPITLRFQSDRFNVGRGFLAQFAVKVCDAEYWEPKGEIKSLHFPRHYENNMACQYIIHGREGHTTTLTFDHFRLEDSYSCQRDNFTVYEGRGNNGRVLGVFCGSRMPHQLRHIGPLTIVFQSDGNRTESGYRFRYTVACERTYSGQNGIITSPGYPRNYQNRLNCTFEVLGRGNKTVLLTFESFDLEDQWSCSYDSLTVKAGRKSVDGRVLGRFCGRQLPRPIRNRGPITMIFKTDKMNQRPGFRMRYEVFDACGGLYNKTHGTILSPNYPRNYSANQNCEYHIPGRPDQDTTLRFFNFNLQDSPGCSADGLFIYRGSSSTSGSLLHQFCGYIRSELLTFRGPITLLFKSDRYISGRGFFIDYMIGYGDKKK